MIAPPGLHGPADTLVVTYAALVVHHRATEDPVPDNASITPETSRRGFLRRGVAAAVALPALASVMGACDDTKAAAAPVTTDTTTAAKPAVRSAREQADAMDAMHEKGVKAFPAKTEGKGNQLLAPRMEKGVKVYELTAEEVQWEVEPGRRVKAWAYNGQVPGPQIRVREGDRVRVTLVNKLSQSTAIHFHGLELPNDQDGVPFVTQPPVKPGESYTYEFTVPNAGSHMYHSHHNAAVQVGNGLLGAFIVEPKRPRAAHRADVDHVMVLNDGSHGYTLNGKGFPATEPLACRQGQTVRIRFMNEGMMIHPMHLHGMHMTVIAKDGWDQPAPWKCDTLNIAPGERWDVLVKATNPGTWAFHCHILPHAESEHGMFGMVTALVVQKAGVA
ncbi:MAG TPA: multicopper oxidase domain-containing protein [Gemmatimonadales bacterium]|nr:multicopper oxidase domain-containing protein [Gemmatimonadales bacterium]